MTIYIYTYRVYEGGIFNFLNSLKGHIHPNNGGSNGKDNGHEKETAIYTYRYRYRVI